MNNFGKIEGNIIMDSLFGWAIKDQDDHYVYYNSNESRFVVVDDVIFELEDELKLFPVFKEKIKVGNIVLYDNEFVHIVEVKENGYLKGVSYKTGKMHEFTTSAQVDGKGYYQVVKKSKK